MRRPAILVPLTVVLVVVVFALGLVAFAYSGSTNVAASQDYLPGAKWFFDTTSTNSIKAHAQQALERGEITEPAEVTDAMLRRGASEHHAMCVPCHGTPRGSRGEFGRGMKPEPPDLAHTAGPPEVISDEVAAELAMCGFVRRIAGRDVIASNIVNAGYKDSGGNFGWWFGHVPRAFGWGIAQSGHNFIFANADMPLHAIPAVVLGHMGKHGPLLFARRDEVPERVRSYLDMVRPHRTASTETILNHGWVIGGETALTWKVQRQLTQLLAPHGTMQEVGNEPDGADAVGTSAR